MAGIARTTDITEQYICQAKKLLLYHSVIIRYIYNGVAARGTGYATHGKLVLDAGHETIRPLSLQHGHDHRRLLVTVGICKLSGKSPISNRSVSVFIQPFSHVEERKCYRYDEDKIGYYQCLFHLHRIGMPFYYRFMWKKRKNLIESEIF